MRSINELVIKKREAVRYRLAGLSLAQVKERTGLSVPTIIKAYEAFQCLGWPGVEAKARGRKPVINEYKQNHHAALLLAIQSATQDKKAFCSLDDILSEYSKTHKAISKKTLLRRLHDMLPEQDHKSLFELLNRPKRMVGLGAKSLIMGFFSVPDGCVFYIQDRRGERRFSWSDDALCELSLVAQLDRLISTATSDRMLLVVIKTDSLNRFSSLAAWRARHKDKCMLFAQWSLTQMMDQSENLSIKR